MPELFDTSSDLNYGNVEGIRDRHHGSPRGVGVTALDARQMRDGDPGPLGDGFLGHPGLPPQLADRGAERRLRIA